MVGEVARVFLKLGILGFGGPAAHLALMEEELVTKRKWLDREHFLDLAGLTNLIPGPNSTELAIHLGYVRAGWRGLVTAGVCFLLPAVLITTIFAVAYGLVDDVARFTYGLKRSPIVASLFNALLLFGAMGVVTWEAIGRLRDPSPVSGATIIWVTLVGLAVNFGTAFLFIRGRSDLNIRMSEGLMQW